MSDDYSLVDLAALARDPVLLAALRETAVLYAAVAIGGAAWTADPEYIREVDEILQTRAARFVEDFRDTKIWTTRQYKEKIGLA